MTEKKKISEDTLALRQKAEDKLKSRSLPMPEDIAALSPEQIQEMVHKLRVHQIELEIQNEELQAAQADLEESRSRYFDLYDMAPVGYCTISEKGLILKANLTAAAMLNKARSALVKQLISRFILKEDQDIYYLHRKQLLETGESQECELRLVKSDGELFWAHLKGTTAQAEDGAPVCRLVLSDITNRKREEEALRRNEKDLRESQRIAHVGSWRLDVETNQVVWTEELYNMYGFDPSLPPPPYTEHMKLFTPESWEKLSKALARTRETGIPYTLELETVRKDGSNGWMWVQGEAEVDSAGRTVELCGAAQDITERKRMEEALREKTKFLQKIIDTTSDLVSVTDMEGNFKFIGSSHSILGYDQDSLVGRNVMELVHPDDYQETATAFAEFLANREDGRKVEYRYLRADGNYIWFETVGKFILDDAGNPKEILFSSRDFTARKRAEGELKRIEWMLSRKPVLDNDALTEPHDQGYGDLTELNRDGVILKSIGRERLKNFANEYLELLGTSSAIYEVNGDYAFGIFASGWCRMMDSASRKLCNTPDNVEALNSGQWLCHESCWSDCAKKAIINRAEVEIACNGGIRLYAVPIYAGGNVIGVINFGYGDPPKDPEKRKMLADAYHLNYDDLVREATAYDSRPPYIIEMAKKRLSITAKLIGSMVEANQATEALKESEELLETTGRMARVGGWQLNAETMAVTWTKETYRIHEVPPDSKPALGKAIAFFHPDDRESLSQAIQLALDRGEPYDMELQFITAKGNKLWTRTICRPEVVDGKTVRLQGTFQDITERKQAEIEREKLQTQLNQAQKMESVGRLAGGVAHDFNNMLGVILGHTELALLQADENHDLYDDLKEIQKAALRSADITKQLLAFARKQTISPKQLDLNATVESMLNMLRRLIGEDIDLVWQPAAHIWPVKMDPSQIDQILANLCVNARDAIDGVGKLTIETGKKTFDEEYCSNHPGFIPGDFVLLAVSDNGCGMDKDTLDNLFEPFFTTKEVGKGTGLGLATIYGIVKQNSGFINVYSEPGQGSTFKIYLPRLFVDEDTDKAVPEKKAAAGGTETILLVEDEPSILRMTQMMLERKGYTVLAAATPAEAVEKAKNHSGAIDLLMTDVVMPEMNGRDLAEKITDHYPDIRLLFMSGYTANVIAHHGVLDDGVAFIQKPFSMADMTAKVRELLDMASDKT